MASAKPIYTADATDTSGDGKGQLSDGVREYYQRIAGEMEQGFEDDDHRHVFLRNVFEQLSTEAVEVCQCRNLSPTVESLVRLASPENLIAMFDVFGNDWSKVCSDRFASFVAQTLLLRTHKCLQHVTMTDEESSKLRQYTTELFDHLIENFDEYIEDVSASHIMRIVIQIYTCVPAMDMKESKSKENDRKKTSTHEYISLDDKLNTDDMKRIQSMTENILEHTKFTEYLTESIPSVVLQTLMVALCKRDTSLSTRLCDAILPHIFENKILATDAVGSRIVEQLLAVSPDTYFGKLFDTIVEEKLKDWSCHPSANFIIQKLLLNLRSIDQFTTIFDKLCENLESVLASKCFMVVTNLAKAALKFGKKQEQLVKILMEAFHCYTPESRRIAFVPLIASISAYEFFYDIKPKDSDSSDSDSSEDESDSKERETEKPTLKNIVIHGSFLLQTLLNFGQPALVVSSLLELSKAELLFMVCHQSGSHIIEAFLASKTIGAKNKDTLVSKLKGCYVDIACSKCGSHVFEKIWARSSATQKNSLAAELVFMQTKVENDRIGSIMWKKYDIRSYTKGGKGSTQAGNKNFKKKTTEQLSSKRKLSVQESDSKDTSFKQEASPKKKQKQSVKTKDNGIKDKGNDQSNNVQNAKSMKSKEEKSKSNVKESKNSKGQSEAKRLRADGTEWEVKKRPSKRQRKAMKLKAEGNK